MFTKHVIGDGNEGLYALPFSDTAPRTAGPFLIGDMDAVGLQLIVDYQVDQVTVADTDNVVASTKTFTFSNYDFTGLVGATITITGATNAGNNASFVISSVTSAHVVVCTTASGLVNETFDPTKVTVTVAHTESAATPAGDFTVLASNDYVAPGAGGVTPSNTGHFSDVTALFAKPTTIAPVTDAGSQFVQSPCSARHLKVVWTPSGGKGVATVAVFAKSWSL